MKLHKEVTGGDRVVVVVSSEVLVLGPKMLEMIKHPPVSGTRRNTVVHL